MEFTQRKICFGIFLLTFSALFAINNAAQISLSANYQLEYNIINNGRSIEFKIQAINVTGWVGIGINNNSANMDGGDFFIGGHNASSRTAYGNDYYVPRGNGNTRPTVDTINNWSINSSSEVGNTTNIHVTRLLDTGDTNHDQVIENKVVNVIWSYNLNNDNVASSMHTARGSQRVNLVSTGGGGGGGGTTPSGATTPRATTPNANSTAPYFDNFGFKTVVVTSLVVAGLGY